MENQEPNKGSCNFSLSSSLISANKTHKALGVNAHKWL